MADFSKGTEAGEFHIYSNVVPEGLHILQDPEIIEETLYCQHARLSCLLKFSIRFFFLMNI